MKDFKIPFSILLASIIISVAIIISSKNDQLSNCVNRLIKSEDPKVKREIKSIIDAVLLCNHRK